MTPPVARGVGGCCACASPAAGRQQQQQQRRSGGGRGDGAQQGLVLASDAVEATAACDTSTYAQMMAAMGLDMAAGGTNPEATGSVSAPRPVAVKGAAVARFRRFQLEQHYELSRYCRQLAGAAARTEYVRVEPEEARAMTEAFSPDGNWHHRVDTRALRGLRARLDEAITVRGAAHPRKLGWAD
jgi:hypothetical protein